MENTEKKVEEKTTKKSKLPKINLVLNIILFACLFIMLNNFNSENSILDYKIYELGTKIETSNDNINKNSKKIENIFNLSLKKDCKGDDKCLNFIERIKKEGKEIVLKNEQCCRGFEEDKNIKILEELNNYKICKKEKNHHGIKFNPSIRHDVIAAKPIIYLYPQQKQKVKVKLDYKGKIITDYPEYDKKIKGWEVEAYPDGKIVDLRDKKEYSYLFWEGLPNKKIDWDLSTGFIVEGKNARKFLREKLEYLGLTPKEYNEFIVYWYPKMMNNKYNLIHFATKKYTDSAPLKITPKPDSMLRVFMLMKSVGENTKVKPQILEKFKRKGFAVIEWGGSELK